MTYEVTDGTTGTTTLGNPIDTRTFTRVYRLSYDHDQGSKHAWISSTEYDATGTAHTTIRTEIVYWPGAVPGYHVPGPWIASE